MPQDNLAGVTSVQLDDQLRFQIFGHPEQPTVCGQLQASVEMCWAVENDGMHARRLMRLEDLTRPR